MIVQKLQILIEAQDRATKKLEGIRGKLESMKDGMRRAGMAATAMGAAITGALAMSVKEYQAQEKAEARLEQLTRSISKATDEQIKKLKEQASALQKVGVVADDVVISGQSQLATFALTAEQIEMLTPVLGDMIVAQKGVNATQEDAIILANAIGRAIDGGVGALTRYGITLTETQKELYKTATREERVALLTEILEGNYGGLNEKMRETTEGGIKALKNELGDLAEKIGEVLIPFIEKLVEKLTPLIGKISNWIDKNPELTETIVTITAVVGGLMTVLGPLLLILPGLVAAFTALTSPIGLVVGAITVLTSAVTFLIIRWKKLVESIKSFGGIGKVVSSVGRAIGGIFGIGRGRVEGSFQTGGVVPKTGIYQLHQGEVVIPAEKKVGDTFVFHFEGANIVDRNTFINEIVKSITRRSKLASLGI